MSEITQKEYWQEVREIPIDIIEEGQRQGYSGEKLAERARERLFEWIDGHEWIIYTWAYPYVLIHCTNEDALFESQGPVENVDSYASIMQQMAFYSFYEDVGEALERALDELPEEEDEEEEEE